MVTITQFYISIPCESTPILLLVLFRQDKNRCWLTWSPSSKIFRGMKRRWQVKFFFSTRRCVCRLPRRCFANNPFLGPPPPPSSCQTCLRKWEEPCGIDWGRKRSKYIFFVIVGLVYWRTPIRKRKHCWSFWHQIKRQISLGVLPGKKSWTMDATTLDSPYRDSTESHPFHFKLVSALLGGI